MTQLKLIVFLVMIAIGVGVDRYMEKEFNFSVLSVSKKAFEAVTKEAFRLPDLGKLETTFDKTSKPGGPEIVGPCNASGGCDTPNAICQPVKVEKKTELRCVRTPEPEKIEETKTVTGTPKTTTPIGTKPTITPAIPVTETVSYGKGKVKISSVSPSSSFNTLSTITLYNTVSQNETLALAGWRIKTKRDEVVIPKAVEVYNPYGFSSPADIKLKSGDYVYIYSSQSKLGVSFRLNKCMGYLETTYRFKPSLPLNCPRLYETRGEIVNLTNACQDYVTSLSSCSQPSANPPVPTSDDACREFLNKVNYGGCFNKHVSDSDFLSREWRVFLGDPFKERDIVDPRHDRVQLFNKAGTLVDEYIY